MTLTGQNRERLLPYWLFSFGLHLAAVTLFVWLGGGRVPPPPVRVIVVDLKEPGRRPDKEAVKPAATPPAKIEHLRPPSRRIKPAAPEVESPRRSGRQLVSDTGLHEAPAATEPTSVLKSDAAPVPRTPVSDKAPAEAPVPRPSVAPKIDVAPEGRYLAQIRGLIERRKEYPVQARKTGQTGTTMVSFILKKHGELVEARVAGTSGRTLLDRAALRAVESVGRFPPFPDHSWGDSRAFQVPISFRIE